MKRFLNKWTLLLTMALVLCVALVYAAYIGGAIVDEVDETDKEIIERNASLSDIFFRYFADMLDLDENGTSTVTVDGKGVNELLYAASRSLDFGNIKIKSLYVSSSDGEYRINAPLEVFGIRSRLSGRIKVYNAAHVLYVTVDDLTIGSLPASKALLGYFGIDGAIVNALEKRNISAFFEGETLKVKLSREAIGRIIVKWRGNSPNAGFIEALYNILAINSDAIKVTVNNVCSYEIRSDLSLFGGEESSRYNSVGVYVSELLKNGTIGAGDAKLVANYYVNGYESLNRREKERINDLLGDTKAPEEIRAHAGLIERREVSMTDLLLSQFDYSPGKLSFGFKISDEMLSAKVTEIYSSGKTWVFTNYETKSCGFIIIEDIFFETKNDALTLTILLGINGYRVPFSIDLACPDSPITAVTGRVTQVRAGTRVVSGRNAELLFDYLSGIIAREWLTPSVDDMSLTIDFTSFFDASPVFDVLDISYDKIKTSCQKSALGKGGYINISISIK